MSQGCQEVSEIFLFLLIMLKSKAEEYGHDLKREIVFLFTHGLLHLLGFDHMIEEDEIQMIAMQKSILDALNITRR